MASDEVPEVPRTQLMLHGIDGTFPFLTPRLLRSCFPASKVSDVLMLGQAIRDTCVVPTGIREGDNPKPTGYTVSGKLKQDHWVMDYKRVTVPSFDYLADARPNSQRGKQSKPSASVGANAEHILLWTPNGRVKLTPELTYDACEGLCNDYEVPLFDMALSSSKNRFRKAHERTIEWTKDFNSRVSLSKQHRNRIWVPFLVGGDPSRLEERLKQVQTDENTAGVLLVGWNEVPETNNIFSRVGEILNISRYMILNTQSLAEVLRACRHPGVVVGSELPTKWAQEKKAFSLNIDWDNSSRKRKRTDGSDDLNGDGCIELDPPEKVTSHTWFKDQRPVMEGCQCMTCNLHTRAYIYHLVCAKELLAEILLFVHNLHHVLEMLRLFNRNEADRENIYYFLYSQISGPSDSLTVE